MKKLWIIRFPLYLDKKLADFLRWLIQGYRQTFSPDHGPLRDKNAHVGCKFYPTCSEYSLQAFKKYGFLIGGAKTGWRILRCHPWSEGGIDKP